MTKRVMTTALVACFVLAVNLNVSADCKMGHKTKHYEHEKSETFLTTVKKVGRYCLLYIPNRIVDALDMYTYNITFGNNFSLEMQATRYAQLGGSTGEYYFIGKAFHRQYGIGDKKVERFGLTYGEYDVTSVENVCGNIKEYEIFAPDFLTANFRIRPFQDEDVDFWKVGFGFGWFVGFNLGLHPVEVADFFTGIFGIDISRDDF